ncbi:MAG: glycosyltransferase [Xanthomonadaceae bacterium]|nr:glycosyltransferase [Rhodospirillaceae bacterium]NIA17627.1 glycosyltransferase [Xanthomonadaceae bacterium]
MKYKKIDFSKYDIIHTNAEFGWWFRQKNKLLIITIHHNPFDKEFQKYTSIAQKIFYYLWIKPNFKKSLLMADKIVAVSRCTKSSVVNYFKLKKNIKVIYNGIDTDFFRPINCGDNKNKKTRILFVGNLIKRKGVDLLPKIMKGLGDDYELYFTSGKRTKIPKKLKARNMISLGKLNDKQLLEEYNKCEILLFPSRLEGFGYCVVEVMACGKPVVITDYSALREIIKDEKNGYLCEINNVDDFVDKIKMARKKLDDGGSFSSSRDYVKNRFSLKVLAEKYKKFYKLMALRKYE